MTLLSIGMLAVAATGFYAARAFTDVEMRERVLREAESVLDSLVTLGPKGTGSRPLHGAVLSWIAGDSNVVTVRVSWPPRPPLELKAVR
jgi:hypothetical protein